VSFWHQGPVRHPLTSFPDPAVSDGRYHRRGETGVWYASDREQAAWAEMLRHFTDDGVDPFEIRRRIGRVRVVGLSVLDLTDFSVQHALGLTEADLIGDDYAATQAVAAAARDVGFDGLLAPSAALAGRLTLVIFAPGQRAVSAELSRVCQPPPRLADLGRAFRPHADMPAAVHAYLRSLFTAGSEVIRRNRS
jgi:RES domain-containing protein